jgi:hypothetical protein
MRLIDLVGYTDNHLNDTGKKLYKLDYELWKHKILTKLWIKNKLGIK